MSVLNALGHWFIEPQRKVTQEEERKQAKLLSLLLLFVLFIDLAYLAGTLLFSSSQYHASFLYGGMITTVILLSAYFVSRTQWYETAVYLFAVGFGWTIIQSLNFSPNSYSLIVFFLLPVMLASIVLSISKTAVVAIIEFAFILYLVATFEAPPGFWEEASVLIALYLMFVGLVLLSVRHRNKIEETRRAQLMQQETKLQTYFENASDWLFALDTHGRVSAINPAACEELGYAANEIIGQPPQYFLAKENQPAVQTMLEEIFQGKELAYAEIVAKDKNGRSLWLEVKGRKLFENDEIIGTFHVARNITDRKIAEAAREKLDQEIKLLYETGHRLGQKIDLKTVYNIIYDSIIAVVNFKTFIVSSYDPDSQLLTIDFGRQQGQEMDISQFPPMSLADEKMTLPQKVILNGSPLIINNYFEKIPSRQQMHFWNPESTSKTACSIIMLPLKVGDQVQGIIQIHDDKNNAFSQDDLHFLEALSSHIIAAITNANLLQQSQNELVERHRAEMEARHRQRVAETLQASIAILNSSLSLEDVLTQILVQLSTVLPYDSAAIQQKEGEQLFLKAARGFQNNSQLIGLSFGIETNLPNAEVIRTQAPLALNNVAEAYPEFQEIASRYQAENICSWLGVPLIVERNVIGMITIDRNEERPFGPEEITLATTFANHAAMALNNAALYRKLETYSELLEKAVTARTLELQRTSEQVHAILNNSPEAILFLNANHHIQQWNPAFLQLFEYEDDEVATLSFSQLVAEADHDKFKFAVETAVTTATTQRLDIITQSKNGRFIEVNAALAPIHENGTLIGIVCSLHDVSKLIEVQRLKDAFVANVSHELRTPITNLRLHHDLLHINPPKQDVYIARLGREIDRLNLIIEDLLRISRLDQKRIDLILTEVDLIGLVEQYVNDRQSSAQNKGITLSISNEPTIPLIQGDARLLEQVIGILFTNAINFTPPGGQIHFSPEQKKVTGQDWVGICISDTGSGIPEDEQAQVFTRFFRGQAAIETGEPGTGLGLAIAQEIMYLHQGYIELESSTEDGSTFAIWLPAAKT